MNKQEIRNHILKTLWDSWDKNNNIGLYLGVFSPLMFEQFEDTIVEVIENLQSEELYRDSYGGELTGKGIKHAEEQNLADAERVLYHQNLRHKILSLLFQLNESKGYSASIQLTELTKEINTDINEIGEEHHLLCELGLVKNHHPSITREGIDYWNKYLLLESFKNEFLDLENLEGITPQQRGRKLEQLISEVLEFAGWNQEANVTTSYEQIDVVIHHNREFYLIECKWEKDPIEADAIDKLFGKLSKRIGTNGFLMSMSGFTSGTIQNVQDSANQKLILLFGKEDIEEIIVNPNSFELLLNEKYKELVMRRKAIYK
jgi:hypothetical protein